jgi:hypothetical protein
MAYATKLVDIETVLAQARGKAYAAGRALDPQYSWTAETMADNLLDNEEEVFTIAQGVNGHRITYLITEDTAATLAEFITDFTIPAGLGATR